MGEILYKSTTNNISDHLIDRDLITDSEKRYRELFKTGSDGIISLDKTGRITECNPAFRSMLGYTDGEILNVTYGDLTPAKWHILEKKILSEQADRRGYSEPYEKEYIKKDGGIISVEIRTYLKYDKEGIPCGYWAIVRDIAEKKLGEQRVTESERLLNTISYASPVGIGKIKDRIIIWVNNTLCRLTGYTAYELKGMKSLFAYESIEEYERVGRVVYKEGFVETKIVRKDGTSFDAQIYISPTDSYSYIFIVIDVTRQKEIERRARAILDQTFQFIGFLSIDGILVEVNRTALDFIGAVPSDVIGMPFWDTPWWRHSKEVQDNIRTAITRALEGEFVRFDVDSPPVYNGKTRHIDLSIKPIKDEHARVVSLIVEGRDISELKSAKTRLELAEAALRESEQRLVDIIQLLPDATLAIDTEGRAIIWNKATEEMTGVKAENIIGKGDYEYAIPFYGKRRPILVDLLLKPEPEIESKYDFVTKKGDTYFAEVFIPEMYEGKGAYLWTTASRLYSRNGDVAGAIESIRDITESKKAEIFLRVSEEKYRNIFENTIEGIFQITPEGTYINANPALLRMLGYASLSELNAGITDIGRQLYANPIDWDEFISLCEKAGHVEGIETQLKKSDGGLIWVSKNVRAVRDDGGRTVYYEGTVIDITERKQAEIERKSLQMQLVQSQKMEAIGALAGGIAHDFNNILTALIGYANLMQMKMEENNPMRVYVDQILSSSLKASQLTKSLLTFSRKQPIVLNPIKLNDIIRGTEKLLKRIITEDIILKTDLTPDELIVMADTTQIDQILFNLASNARDAMPSGGVLTIETKKIELHERLARIYGLERGGAYALLSVSDTGIGIDEAIKDKIFEPFFTTKEPGKGTGLGLSTVYGIVKQHNGYIAVYSEPGSGTTFHIYLPVVGGHDDEKKSITPSIRGGNETILIAEDNEEARNLLKTILTHYGYNVLETADGEEAVKTFRENKDIDLLILDSVMPKKSGRGAYEEIRKTAPDIRVLFTSGYTQDIVLEKDIKEGEFNFIHKPFSPHEMLIKVREILDR